MPALLGLSLATPVSLSAASRHVALYTTTHPAMGTVFILYLYGDSAVAAAAISEEVFDEVDRVEQLLSIYRESSELSRINREAGSAPVVTDPEMMDFLKEAAHWSEASDGAFDITVGPLMKAWGFYRHEGRVPSDAELDKLRSVTGWQKVALETHARTVAFAAPGMELDPGGIGKGFAVDAVVRILRSEQVAAAMISAGGSTVYGLGAPPHQPGWKVVVPGPLPRNDTLSVIMLRDTSLSSADCSQKNFTLGGHTFCHIMNPQTMRPVEGRVQVSVVHPSATASDALSNVVFVLPPKQSLLKLQQYAPDSRALIVSSGGTGSSTRDRCTQFRWNAAIQTAYCEVQ